MPPCRHYCTGSAASNSRCHRWQRDAVLAEQPTEQWPGVRHLQGYQHTQQLCPSWVSAAREGHTSSCLAGRCWVCHTICCQGDCSLNSSKPAASALGVAMGQECTLCIGLLNEMQLVSNVCITSVTCKMSHARCHMQEQTGIVQCVGPRR